MLPPGTHQYKFKVRPRCVLTTAPRIKRMCVRVQVDSTWVISPSEPVAYDSNGIVNNKVDVPFHVPISHHHSHSHSHGHFSRSAGPSASASALGSAGSGPSSSAPPATAVPTLGPAPPARSPAKPSAGHGEASSSSRPMPMQPQPQPGFSATPFYGATAVTGTARPEVRLASPSQAVAPGPALAHYSPSTPQRRPSTGEAAFSAVNQLIIANLHRCSRGLTIDASAQAIFVHRAHIITSILERTGLAWTAATTSSGTIRL
jgi:hypothetical protein